MGCLSVAAAASGLASERLETGWGGGSAREPVGQQVTRGQQQRDANYAGDEDCADDTEFGAFEGG